MSQPEIYWAGYSGREYGYYIYPMDASFRKIAGNVIFAKQDEAGEWLPLYIGETRNFDEGFADPEMIACAKEKGATHVHTHFNSPSHDLREAERDDLIEKWKPTCNR